MPCEVIVESGAVIVEICRYPHRERPASHAVVFSFIDGIAKKSGADQAEILRLLPKNRKSFESRVSIQQVTGLLRKLTVRTIIVVVTRFTI